MGADSASVRWAVREHRSPRPLGGARFRLLFDRCGQQPKFHRFVYLPERSDSARCASCAETPTWCAWRACSVVRSARWLPATTAGAGHPARAWEPGGVDCQLLTLALLAVDALLVLLAAAAWAALALRRKLRAGGRAGLRPRSPALLCPSDLCGHGHWRVRRLLWLIAPTRTVCALSERTSSSSRATASWTARAAARGRQPPAGGPSPAAVC